MDRAGHETCAPCGPLRGGLRRADVSLKTRPSVLVHSAPSTGNLRPPQAPGASLPLMWRDRDRCAPRDRAQRPEAARRGSPSGCAAPRSLRAHDRRCPGLPLAMLARALPRRRTLRRARPPASPFRCRVTRHCTMLRMVAASPAPNPAHRRSHRSRHVRSSPRSPWPAAPAAGIASAHRRCTPCVAGNGFAVHRPPHRAVQQCPRECRCSRRPARHGASHPCPRSRRRGRPLKRRGGSPPPGSPASISPSSMLRISVVPTARGGLGSHTPRIGDAGGAYARLQGISRVLRRL